MKFPKRPQRSRQRRLSPMPLQAAAPSSVEGMKAPAIRRGSSVTPSRGPRSPPGPAVDLMVKAQAMTEALPARRDPDETSGSTGVGLTHVSFKG